MNGFTTIPKVYDFLIILTDLMSFVCCSFQVLSEIAMDVGIESGKSLCLGMPKAPKGKIQGHQKA